MTTRPSKQPFYITTAIAYVNGAPHLGHAYEMILTDVVARFMRLDDRPVYFLTGTDEHGQKVADTAAAQNKAPQDFCDKIAAKFIEMADRLNISNNDFLRTTQDRHYKASQALWQKLKDRGDIYLGSYAGWYSVRDEAFFTEDELIKDPETGTFKTKDGAAVEWMEQPSYFFKLSAYTDALLSYYEAHPAFIAPHSRRNEIINFVKQGLKDLSISRTSFDWGVPVPDDPDHVMYVWLDALTNYLTGLGYPDENNALYQEFWPASLHVIGKDITRFHCIFWPAFLMAADLPLPKTVFAHGFINVEGQKMSKSIGNVIAPDDLVDTYGLDGTRYILMREIPHGDDGNYASETARFRVNADLANGLGNLAQRSLSMIYKNCEGKLPAPHAMTEEDQTLLNAIYALPNQVRPMFESLQIHRALEEIWLKGVHACNAYVDHQAPWALKKTDPARMETVLYVLAECVRCLSILISPVMPDSANALLNQLSVDADARQIRVIAPDFALQGGIMIDKPEGVFPRIEAQTDKEAE